MASFGKQEQLRKQMSTAKSKRSVGKGGGSLGVSLETVEQEIEKAIREARSNPKPRENSGTNILPGGDLMKLKDKKLI